MVYNEHGSCVCLWHENVRKDLIIMKKLLVVAVIALLVMALVACGGDETPATTKGEGAVTTPVATGPAATEPKPQATEPAATAPASTALVTSTAPETTTTPETTEELSPMEQTIEALAVDAWWENTSRRNLTYEIHENGSKSYLFTFSLSSAEYFPAYDHDNNPETPDIFSLSNTSAEGARCFIKDMNKDEDYTEYKVINWKTQRGLDVWFEAEGFVPSADGAYDMYIFFLSGEGSTNPGEYVYIWQLESTWTYIPPFESDDAEIQSLLSKAYQCSIHRISKWYDYATASSKVGNDENGNPKLDEATFPVMNFNFTIVSDNTFPHLDGGAKSWQNIEKDTAFAYIKGANDAEFTRYEINYMTLARHCDMWFTLEGFTPVENEVYEMYVFFTAGVGAAHPGALHYVYSKEWIAGPHE